MILFRNLLVILCIFGLSGHAIGGGIGAIGWMRNYLGAAEISLPGQLNVTPPTFSYACDASSGAGPVWYRNLIPSCGIPNKYPVTVTGNVYLYIGITGNLQIKGAASSKLIYPANRSASVYINNCNDTSSAICASQIAPNILPIMQLPVVAKDSSIEGVQSSDVSIMWYILKSYEDEPPYDPSTPGGNYKQIITVYYKIKDGKPVAPDTPDVTCRASSTNITLDHGALTTDVANNHEKISTVNVICDGRANIKYQLIDATGLSKKVPLGQGGISNVDVKAGANSWSADGSVQVSAGTTPIEIRSKIITVGKPGALNGNAILSISFD
ncbi:hypothetical protein H8C13_004339 [Salmonella enterica]|nr:hypothetical protein [Salmonella enterica]